MRKFALCVAIFMVGISTALCVHYFSEGEMIWGALWTLLAAINSNSVVDGLQRFG